MLPEYSGPSVTARRRGARWRTGPGGGGAGPLVNSSLAVIENKYCWNDVESPPQPEKWRS